MSEFPRRKHSRLKEYDYSLGGAYFVTICTKDRKCILSKVDVGPDALIGPSVILTNVGEIAEQYIKNTEMVYPGIIVEHYVIMPNHVHILLRIETGERGPMRASGPTVGVIIKGIKGMTTRALGHSVWQEKFHDHVIRDENDFLNHWQYIDSNPARWAEDEYYMREE